MKNLQALSKSKISTSVKNRVISFNLFIEENDSQQSKQAMFIKRAKRISKVHVASSPPNNTRVINTQVQGLG